MGVKVSEEETGRLDVYVPGGQENKSINTFLDSCTARGKRIVFSPKVCRGANISQCFRAHRLFLMMKVYLG